MHLYSMSHVYSVKIYASFNIKLKNIALVNANFLK